MNSGLRKSRVSVGGEREVRGRRAEYRTHREEHSHLGNKREKEVLRIKPFDLISIQTPKHVQTNVGFPHDGQRQSDDRFFLSKYNKLSYEHCMGQLQSSGGRVRKEFLPSVNLKLV